MVSVRSCIPLLVGVAVLFLAAPCESLETSSDVYILCNTRTYDNRSSFDEDLNTLLTDLKQKAGSSSYHVRRAATLSGAYQCRGDLAPDACSKCVSDAAQSALSSCPSAIGSRVQLNGCFLRYENYTFAVPDSSIVLELCNVNKDESSAFQSQVSNLLGKVTAAAPANGRLFASAMSALSSNATLYALAQCLGYLSQTECSHCLAAHPTSWQDCDHAVGAQIHSVSCYYRFEIYPFFYD
ncbi:hypothetical protein L7F22_030246 [Adiantum nelumboides]|nr:hypothetical protein [Adiantum nelumboides]